MSLKDTLEAIDAEEKAAALAEQRFQASKVEWEEIQARRAARFSGGNKLIKVVELVRKYGPRAAKYLGYPGLATAITATTMAEDGTFIGESGILTILGQLIGW